MLEGSDFPLSENPTIAELARELLLYRMREYSEAMCASWLSCAEYDIWELGESGRSDPKEAAWLRRIALDCRKLSAMASGWWVYDSNAKAAGENAWSGQNPHFITLTEWKERYAAWCKNRLHLLRDQAREAAERGMEPEAAARWAKVPAGDQAAFLQNQVWCAHCRTCQPLHPSGGCTAFISKGLWITGTCPDCGGLLQTEYRGEAAAG